LKCETTWFPQSTICDFDRTTFHLLPDLVPRGIKRFSTQEMSAAAKSVVIGEALFHHSLRICLGNVTELRVVNEL
jgi:hypothetical protein